MVHGERFTVQGEILVHGSWFIRIRGTGTSIHTIDTIY